MKTPFAVPLGAAARHLTASRHCHFLHARKCEVLRGHPQLQRARGPKMPHSRGLVAGPTRFVSRASQMRTFTVGDVIRFMLTQRFGTSREVLLDIPGMSSTSLASLQVLLSDMVQIQTVKEDRTQDVFMLVAAEEEIGRRLASRLNTWIRRI